MRRRMCVAVCAASLWICGCRADDKTGLFATVLWSGVAIDQLAIGVDAAPGSAADAGTLVAPTLRPATAGAPLASPETVAIYLPDALSGVAVTCTVTGLSAGAPVGPPVTATVTVSRGKLAPITFALVAGTDGGATDGAAPDAGTDAAKANGQGCTDGSECESTLCVDGVCCAQTCDGICQACNVQGKEGICMPVPAGTHDTSCAQQPAASCGYDGTCDGSGGCRRYPSGVACAPSSCQTSMLLVAGACDGQGACATPPAISCAPYLCSAAGGAPLCLNTCATNSDCAASNCVNGSCGQKVKAANGAGCATGGDCQSGVCQDGVCCNASCTGACMSCNEIGTVGTCTQVAAGKLDPHGVCVDQGITSCGQNGLCDAAGMCALYSKGATCAAGSCSGGHFVRNARQCDGAGSCVAVADTNCDPYRCDTTTTACFTSCTGNAQCAIAQGRLCVGGVCE